MAIRTQHSHNNAEQPAIAAAQPSVLQARNRVLQSWKEIASELKCGVRTAQRWEKEKGMPVRRLGKGAKAHVFAFNEELYRWLASATSPAPQDSGFFKSIDDFFRARRSANLKQTCDCCGSRMNILEGQFWIYETALHWTLPVPFCPLCDAAAIQGFYRSQIIQ